MDAKTLNVERKIASSQRALLAMTPDEDEKIVEEGVSRFGLHRIHVVRMGAPVDIERWIVEKVLAVGGMVETFYRYEEEDLVVHHLRLYWREELSHELHELNE